MLRKKNGLTGYNMQADSLSDRSKGKRSDEVDGRFLGLGDLLRSELRRRDFVKTRNLKPSIT